MFTKSVSVYEGNGGVARKGWGAGEGTTGFRCLDALRRAYPAFCNAPAQVYIAPLGVLRRTLSGHFPAGQKVTNDKILYLVPHFYNRVFSRLMVEYKQK